MSTPAAQPPGPNPDKDGVGGPGMGSKDVPPALPKDLGDGRASLPVRPIALVAREDPPVVPGYRVSECLGRGSTGTVWRAVQLAVEREVALKVLHPELARNPRVVRRLQREARTMAKLGHPHVISAIDMGQAGERWWYAMELADGPSLADRLRRDGPLSEREALRLFVPLAEALEHLWQHGVVHRDIKPANVLIDRTRGAQLADLGLAFHEDDPGLTRQGGTLGTPHYISPEQARDPRAVDVRSDLWSFGATLFHALCGRPPFQGESLAEVLSAVLHARIPDPRHLAPELSSGMALVLRKCLVREPARRYQTPRELREDLERIRERRAPKLSRASLDPVDRPGAKWRRAGALGLATGVLLVVGLWGVEWRRGAEQDKGPIAPVASFEFAPLEQVLDSVRAQPTRLASAWSNLERMRDAVPVEAAGRWWSVRNEVADTLRQRLGGLLTELSREHERHWSARDYVGAGRVLEREFDQRLRAETGFTGADLPPEAGGALLAWRTERRAGLKDAVQRASDALSSAALLHHEQVVSRELEALVQRQRWREARDLLAFDRERVLQRAGLEVNGLPPEAIDDAMAPLRARYALDRRAVDEAWMAVDRGLREWVSSHALELEALVRSAQLRAPRARLEADFAAHLEQRGVRPEELPEPAISLGWAELERAGRRLTAVFLEVEERDLRDAYTLRAEELAPALLRRRDYESAERLWSALLDRLAASPADVAEEPWHRDLTDKVQRRRAESLRLQAVLDAAATGVQARRGANLELVVGNIRYRGVVDVGVDPLLDGFRLRTGPGRVYPLELRAPLGGSVRQVVQADLESLAGLVEGSAPETPKGRLDLALFRAAEGDWVGASRALSQGPWPASGPEAELAQELSSRLLLALSPSAEGGRSQTGEANGWLGYLDSERSKSDPTAALAAVELLLAEHSQVPAVGLRAVELNRRRDELRRALQ